MSYSHRVKFDDSSHTLSTTLDAKCGVPTAATVDVKDKAGTCLFSDDGVITSAADAGAGLVGFSYTGTGPGFGGGDYVTISGTDSYDGKYLVDGDDGSLFTVTATFVAAETGTFTVQKVATLMTATTLSAAATAGESTITMTAVTSVVEGVTLRIAASADGPHEDVVVQNVNTSTKVVELEEYLNFDHTTAAAVSGRFITYDLDASDTDTFKSGLDMLIVWDLFDTDDPAWREDAEILKREVGFGGLEKKFNTLYPHYHTQIPAGEFDTYQTAAYDELRMLFEWKAQRDIDKLVNPDNLEPVLLRQIAYDIAYAGDDAWEQERLAMKMERDDWLTRMSQALIWIDSDQDDIEDDSEVQSMGRPLHRRRLF